MLALFRNPLLRLLGRLWWLPALTTVAAWGLGGERSLWLAGLGVTAYLAAVAGMIGAAWAHGAHAAFRERARRRSSSYRFLCPSCLHFSGFHFACGACGKKVEDFLVHTRGAYINDCSHCHAHLLPRDGLDGRGVRAYCERCQGNCDRAIHHQRQVRVLATLLPDDFTLLRQIIGAQQEQAQGNISYACDDDGARLAYLLNLNSLTDAARSLSRTHALWELKSIWLNAAGDNTAIALKVGDAADRFDRQTGLAKTLAVRVPQTTLGDAVKNVLETRFGAVEYGIKAADFLGREAEVLVAPKTPLASLSTAGDASEPALTPQTEIEPAGTMVRERVSG